MKRFFTIILSVLLIALIIFAVHQCTKTEEIPETPSNEPVNVEQVDQPTPETIPEKEEQQEVSSVLTGVGIYYGKIDSNFIEISIDDNIISCKLSPELAGNFSSLGLEEETIISFEYKIVDEQYLITKIIK